VATRLNTVNPSEYHEVAMSSFLAKGYIAAFVKDVSFEYRTDKRDKFNAFIKVLDTFAPTIESLKIEFPKKNVP
jgi:hypothetical protein